MWRGSSSGEEEGRIDKGNRALPLVMKRRSINLALKYRIVRALEEGSRLTEVAKKFGMCKSTISGIWRRKEEVTKAYEEERAGAKRLRRTESDEIDRELWVWYRAQVEAGLRIGGPELRRKAEEIGAAVGRNDFVCHNWWIDRFKLRHDISFRRPAREAEGWEHKFWPRVGAGYQRRDVFTVKEIGLYYGMRPDDLEDFEDKVCDRGEDAEERVTVCLCSNLWGEERRRLLVVGSDPVKLRDINLPLAYRANRKSWVTIALFTEELATWDKELAEEDRKVLLLVRYSPAFRALHRFSRVELGYLPSDDPHPLDPAASALRVLYRRYALNHFFKEKRALLGLVDAMRLLHKCWARLPRGVFLTGCSPLYGLQHDPPLRDDWVSQVELPSYISPSVISKYLHFDRELVTSVRFLTDAADGREPLDCSDSESESASPLSYRRIPKPKKALEMSRLLYFFLTQYSKNSHVLNSLIDVENEIENLLYDKNVYNPINGNKNGK
jgi:transposase-like protein